MTKFNKVKDKYIETLELYVPIVARVHGEAHPEFHEVHRLFNAMNEKMKEAQVDKADLDLEFRELGKVTDNYKVPADTCESYEAVYNMLAELDMSIADEKSQVGGVLSHQVRKMKPLNADKRATRIKSYSSGPLKLTI